MYLTHSNRYDVGTTDVCALRVYEYRLLWFVTVCFLQFLPSDLASAGTLPKVSRSRDGTIQRRSYLGWSGNHEDF